MNENEIIPNSVYVKVDVNTWRSYIVFSDSEKYVYFEFPIDEFCTTGQTIAEAIYKGADVSRVMTEMKQRGETLDEMDRMLVALASDGGL